MADISPEKILEELQSEVQRAAPQDVEQWRAALGGIRTVACKRAKLVPPTILKAVETIVDNTAGNKYLFSILFTCCVKKIIMPQQDIRIGQDKLEGGYSNRTFDQEYVTPFLKRHEYTCCEGSGMESGRNFERPIPWDLDYPANPRGKGNRESFLGILHCIQENGGDPRLIALYLLYYQRSNQQTIDKVVVPPREADIAKIMHVFSRHFEESSGQGKSRLPVLALYAIYTYLVREVERYNGAKLAPLERHTTADLSSGSIGDIQVNRDGRPFEGVEVKSEKPITADMVRSLLRKFEGKSVSRYYLLSTAANFLDEKDRPSVAQALKEVNGRTGTQIIVNGLVRTLWYYLRLLKDPAAILPKYSELLREDHDIRPEMVTAWNRIITELRGRKAVE